MGDKALTKRREGRRRGPSLLVSFDPSSSPIASKERQYVSTNRVHRYRKGANSVSQSRKFATSKSISVEQCLISPLQIRSSPEAQKQTASLRCQPESSTVSPLAARIP